MLRLRIFISESKNKSFRSLLSYRLIKVLHQLTNTRSTEIDRCGSFPPVLESLVASPRIET
jgi:hypothetical protein